MTHPCRPAEPLPARWRCELVFGLLMLAVAGLAVRAGLLVTRARPDAVRLAETQQRMVVPLPARPGSIYARTRGGHLPLAVSRQVPSCFVDPYLLEDDEVEDAALRTGAVVDADPIEVVEAVMLRRTRRFAWVARELSEEQAHAVRALRMPAVGILHEWRRAYPNGPLAGTVLGFRRIDGVPGGGLELTHEPYLAANDGRRVLLADAHRRPVWPLPDRSRTPIDGDNVFLHLDAVIQGFLEEAVAESARRFDAQWATGVVMDPRTGEVLGMCSVPGFDPNEYATVSSERRTNRAISVPYEPGSALKPIFTAAAVDAGAATYSTEIDCEDGVYHARRGGRITDHGHHYGLLTLEDVIVKSSNIGMAKIGERMGNERLHAVVERFGFGEPTGIALPGESGGIVRPLDKWDGYSLRRIPFGQEIAVTALQLARGFASLVNGGLLLEPRLVDFVTDSRGNVIWRSRPRVLRRTIRPETSARTLAVLREVVERGTGTSAQLARWSSFGKTGTAQVPGPGGYVDGAYTATYVGGAPATDPAVLCVISVYWPDRSKGYYGSKVAAPYVRDVLARTLAYLEVPGDVETDVLAAGP